MINRKRMRRRAQKTLSRNFAFTIIINVLIIMMILYAAVIVKCVEISGKNKSEDESKSHVYESEFDNHNTETSSANVSTTKPVIPEKLEEPTVEKFSRNLSENDKYLLARMAMAEAEGESIETKIYVILTILNRVESNLAYFPDTVEDVLFQNSNGVYQFSPVMPGGRWWRVEPNAECWEAVEIVNGMKEDISMGALYFESCTGESWHSRNLELLFKSDHMRFYK